MLMRVASTWPGGGERNAIWRWDRTRRYGTDDRETRWLLCRFWPARFCQPGTGQRVVWLRLERLGAWPGTRQRPWLRLALECSLLPLVIEAESALSREEGTATLEEHLSVNWNASGEGLRS